MKLAHSCKVQLHQRCQDEGRGGVRASWRRIYSTDLDARSRFEPARLCCLPGSSLAAFLNIAMKQRQLILILALPPPSKRKTILDVGPSNAAITVNGRWRWVTGIEKQLKDEWLLSGAVFVWTRGNARFFSLWRIRWFIINGLRRNVPKNLK